MATSELNVGLRPPRTRPNLQKILANYGLVFILVLVTAGFSVALPHTFLTVITWQSILQANYAVAIMALAETICIAAGEFDLSIGYNLGFLHILTIGFIVNQHLGWGSAVVLTLVIGCGVGLLNGMLVYLWKINSFIVTLGVGTIITGFAYLYSGGLQISGVGMLPNAFVDIANSQPGGFPATGFFVLILAVILMIVMEFTPVGRYIYALGANRRAAVLAGIRPGRYVIGVFVLSGFITAVASVLYASRTQIGDLTIGAPYLLPVFVGAILGSSVIRPGRPNIAGTIIAVALLGVGLAGLLQIGSGVYVQSLFNGLALILGVGFAGMASRRATKVQIQARMLPPLPEDVTDIVPPEMLTTEADRPA